MEPSGLSCRKTGGGGARKEARKAARRRRGRLFNITRFTFDLINISLEVLGARARALSRSLARSITRLAGRRRATFAQVSGPAEARALPAALFSKTLRPDNRRCARSPARFLCGKLIQFVVGPLCDAMNGRRRRRPAGSRSASVGPSDRTLVVSNGPNATGADLAPAPHDCLALWTPSEGANDDCYYHGHFHVAGARLGRAAANRKSAAAEFNPLPGELMISIGRAEARTLLEEPGGGCGGALFARCARSIRPREQRPGRANGP